MIRAAKPGARKYALRLTRRTAMCAALTLVDRMAVPVYATEKKSRTAAREFQGGESMIICDLCGEARDCLLKEIDGKEYDIYSQCCNPFAQMLRGKERVKNRETMSKTELRTLSVHDENAPGLL